MKPKEPPPTNKELSDSIEHLFIAAHQSALFAFWCLINEPLLQKFGELKIPEAEIHFSTGILESSLMLIRKTTEFFLPRDPKNQHDDNLKAYLYLPHWEGTRVVEEPIHTELHKRIGHITVQNTRYGPIKWPILSMTIKAINQWTLFFRDVGDSPVFQGEPPTAKLQSYFETLQAISGHCQRLQRRTTEF
jgi:hypothetical protein